MKNENIPYDSIENLFGVYFSEEVGLYYNTLEKLTLNIDQPFLYTEYAYQGEDWMILSYKWFGSVKYWWLLCDINKVSNPMEKPPIGTIIKIPKKELMVSILEAINNTN